MANAISYFNEFGQKIRTAKSTLNEPLNQKNNVSNDLTKELNNIGSYIEYKRSFNKTLGGSFFEEDVIQFLQNNYQTAISQNDLRISDLLQKPETKMDTKTTSGLASQYYYQPEPYYEPILSNEGNPVNHDIDHEEMKLTENDKGKTTKTKTRRIESTVNLFFEGSVDPLLIYVGSHDLEGSFILRGDKRYKIVKDSSSIEEQYVKSLVDTSKYDLYAVEYALKMIKEHKTLESFEKALQEQLEEMEIQ